MSIAPRRRLSRRYLPVIALAFTAWLAPRDAAGELLPSSMSVASVSASGSIRTAWWTQSRSLDRHGDIATASAWLNGQLELDTLGTIKMDAWAGVQSRDNAQGDRNDRLRELYWQKYIGDADLRIGRQLIVWGRADGLNPTDNLTPRDFTLLTPDDSDQRFGVFAANLRYHLGAQSLQLVWQPRFESSTIALPELQGVDYRERSPQRRGQAAIKLDHSGTAVDWSLSYLDGDNLIPDFSLVGVRPDGIDIGLTNHRQRVLGADAAMALGPYVFRTEIARTFIDRDDVARDAVDSGASDNGHAEFFRKRPQLQWIVGGERNFTEHYTLNVQYFAQKVFDFDDPDRLTDPLLREIALQQAAASNQTDRFQQGMTFRMAWNWANYAWQLETSGIYILDSGARYWRGKLIHALDDRWRVEFGFDRFSGSDNNVIGRLKDNSTVFAELRYGF